VGLLCHSGSRSALWETQLLLKQDGPQVAKPRGGLRAWQAQWLPPQLRRRFIPTAFDTNCLDHTTMTSHNPTPAGRTSSRATESSVVRRARRPVEFSKRIDPGQPQHSPSPGWAAPSLPEGPLVLVFARAATRQREGTGRAVAAGGHP